jgi:beta-glucosidase/6-phospho-beta-glucosidase/beta-galactosidase
MYKCWKDFIDYREVPFNEYYNKLKNFITTNEGKIFINFLLGNQIK